MEARRPFSQTLDRRALAGRDVWRAFKRWLYWFHRWLGIVTCLFCVMWFATGLVMLYVPFPSWSDEERIAALPPVDIPAVRITPDDALARSGITTMPGTFRLEMFAGEPIYRIVAGNTRASISAVTGAAIGSVSREQAARHVAAAFPQSRPVFAYDVDADQWTPTKRFDPHRPLYRFALNDAADTAVYVSSRTGEIVQNATFSERAWNWVGAVPHWIYFTPIRRDQELWRQAVMWLSGPLVIGAISGVWIGILRLRPAAAKRGKSVSPYRGWMKWHHIAGLIGGLFLTTWIFSGWLSVNPFKWFARTQLSDAQLVAFAGWTPDQRYSLTPDKLKRLPAATEYSFHWVAGTPTVLAKTSSHRVLLDVKTGEALRISDGDLLSAARRMFPSHSMTGAERLTEETVHWYSHHTARPLPVLRAAFDDPSATSIFIDPETGTVAGLSDSSSRTYRWLFNFVHDYDLPVLLRNPPARDILIWLLSLAGMIISVSGIVVGWRVLRRNSG